MLYRSHNVVVTPISIEMLSHFRF